MLFSCVCDLVTMFRSSVAGAVAAVRELTVSWPRLPLSCDPLRSLTQPADCDRHTTRPSRCRCRRRESCESEEGSRGEQRVANECDGWSWLIAVEQRGEEAHTQTANQPQLQPAATLPSRRRDQTNHHIEHEQEEQEKRGEQAGMKLAAAEQPSSRRLSSAPLSSAPLSSAPLRLPSFAAAQILLSRLAVDLSSISCFSAPAASLPSHPPLCSPTA